MTEAQFVKELKTIGINLTDIQIEQLQQYYELLVTWNERMNLTSITDKESVYLKHFYDSLMLAKVIDLNKVSSLCDVGTGAGFPGLVLKIVYPHLHVTLVDSMQKRVHFLNEVITKLDLKNVQLENVRAEDYSKTTREQFDVVTARAVAKLNILLEYCTPLVKEEGYFIPLKGNVDEEMQNISHALKELTLSIEDNIKFKLPFENSERTIIKFKKEAITNKKYPRSYKEILKKPL
jgi:16S rRNA (guanine527-N7)-methyltransferase